MPFFITHGDITKVETDAIVNAANTKLSYGGGVCGSIFRAAGVDEMTSACAVFGGCATGSAVITPAFNLPAKYVIHTPGPRWSASERDKELLTSCYINAMRLATQHKLSSIAFPLISSGIHGCPPDVALSTAVCAIRDYLLHNELSVCLVFYDKAEFMLPKGLKGELSELLRPKEPARLSALRYAERPKPQPWKADSRPVDENAPPPFDDADVCFMMSMPCGVESDMELDNMLMRRAESFSGMLFRLIDARGMSDPDVYKRANIDRRVFSRIRCDPNYCPSKNTALALCVALELDLDRSCDLLRRAGYALSPSNKFDIIVSYFLERGRYDIFEINEALFDRDLSQLGA